MLVMQFHSAAIGQLLTPPPVVMLQMSYPFISHLKAVNPEPHRTPETFSPIKKLQLKITVQIKPIENTCKRSNWENHIILS